MSGRLQLSRSPSEARSNVGRRTATNVEHRGTNVPARARRGVRHTSSLDAGRAIRSNAPVDERTRRYYELHGRELGEVYAGIESPLRRYFAMAFPPGARVLDIGAGVGRDVAELVSDGYQAWGVEPSEAFREYAVVRFPQTGDRIRAGSLPDDMPPADDLGGPFDGIVCSAVLQHLPRSKLFDAVFALRGLLVERGRVLVSIPVERPDLVDSRDERGRLFNGVTPDEIELLFERAGFASVGRWTSDDALGRAGHRWATLAMELRSSGGSRPIDHLEAVLSTREKKVATYKLALIRALCAIALTETRSVRFTADGAVRVPMQAIAERWVIYYWPLFDSNTLLPQMNGESKAGRHLLAFSSELDALVTAYRRQGGLSAFAADRRAGELIEPARPLYTGLLKTLRQTIRVGPVTYAGGSLPSPMFKHDKGDVLVAASIWRELSLMGHWIQDALLLRWAELVSRLSSGEVSVETAIAHLLVSPDPDREAAAARELYLSQPSLKCVWTGSAVDRKSLAVDHVLPYSLWRNNDLWNLLPSHAKVNAAKSDKLPTRELLRARRDAIAHCWTLSREAFRLRFAAESRAQTGDADVDLGRLFDALVESVEVTALQRACPRWEP